MTGDTRGPAEAIGNFWRWTAALLALHAGLLVLFRARFEHDRELVDIPALWLAAGLVSAGVVYLLAVRRIATAGCSEGEAQSRTLGWIIVTGFVLRIAMLWSTPALEDDFYRYLWDGGVAANGWNPYRYAPGVMDVDATPKALRDLAESAGYVHQRINHPNLRTIYPPVAIAAFGLAYLTEAWSLLAWRLVCLAAEGITLYLLGALLKETGRSPLWIAVYWWNPIVIKELMNSAHMEAILVPMLLGALLLAMRQRHLAGVALLGLAAATKVWPILLVPLLLRALIRRPLHLAAGLAMLAAIGVLAAWPVLAAGLDRSSGFVAYAAEWRTSSALYPLLETAWRWALWPFGLSTGSTPGSLARAVMALAAGSIALLVARTEVVDAQDLAVRATVVVAALVLLSPAQFPWYIVWVQPFLVLVPVKGLLLASALMPLYYVSFYFSAIEQYWVFRDVIVWAIWLPVWLLIARQVRVAFTRQPRPFAGPPIERAG